MHQPAPDVAYSPPTITINGNPLHSVDHFKYLGSTISRDLTLDAELAAHTQCLRSSVTRLWNRHGVRLSTKLRVYQAIILPCLLYSAEAYTLYRRHIK